MKQAGQPFQKYLDIQRMQTYGRLTDHKNDIILLPRQFRCRLPKYQAVYDAFEILLPPAAGESRPTHGFGVGGKLGERSFAAYYALSNALLIARVTFFDKAVDASVLYDSRGAE